MTNSGGKTIGCDILVDRAPIYRETVRIEVKILEENSSLKLQHVRTDSLTGGTGAEDCNWSAC